MTGPESEPKNLKHRCSASSSGITTTRWVTRYFLLLSELIKTYDEDVEKLTHENEDYQQKIKRLENEILKSGLVV